MENPGVSGKRCVGFPTKQKDKPSPVSLRTDTYGRTTLKGRWFFILTTTIKGYCIQFLTRKIWNRSRFLGRCLRTKWAKDSSHRSRDWTNGDTKRVLPDSFGYEKEKDLSFVYTVWPCRSTEPKKSWETHPWRLGGSSKRQEEDRSYSDSGSGVTTSLSPCTPESPG